MSATSIRISWPRFVAMLLASYALAFNVLFLAAAGPSLAQLQSQSGVLCLTSPADAGLHKGAAGGSASHSACFDHCMAALGSGLPQQAMVRPDVLAGGLNNASWPRDFMILAPAGAIWPRGPPTLS